MEIKSIIGIFNDWFNKLKPKERRMFIIFIAVLFFCLYFALYVNPALKKISSFKKQEREAKSRALILTSQFPEVDKVRIELDSLKTNVDSMKLKSADIESKLLGENQVPKLLTELVKCSLGSKIDFQSVKQKSESDKEGFLRLYIDIKFEASYEDAVNYIKKVEGISPFVKVAEINLAQSKNDPRNLVNVSLRLSAILGMLETKQATFAVSGQPEVPKLNIGRSPLTPRFGIGTTKKKTLKLTGITYRQGPGFSSAIINDTVVKAGDEIEGCKVESILFDSVEINDGMETKILKVER